jgi:hypothetical protein
VGACLALIFSFVWFYSKDEYNEVVYFKEVASQYRRWQVWLCLV